jgi:ectoine hydroxylase-related dioxygenase (phytanoyl-CoA dioxygenase family)
VSPTLDASKQLVSDLWVDQPDAHDHIARALDAGEITPAEAEQLGCFVDQGYMAVHVDLPDDFGDRFEADLERLWQERPYDLAAAPQAGERVSFRDFDEANRSIGYRVVDMHSHSAAALDLYTNPQIFRMVELAFGEPAISFQSLYFHYGSEQALHRDPMFVPTKPPSLLIASWTALEDISDECGPLLYAPGSHRMPWFEFSEDTVSVVKTETAQEMRQQWAKERDRRIQELGLEVKSFTCARGDTFLWHAGLLHGGKKVIDPSLTRKSFVTHYSTARAYKSRKASMLAHPKRDADQWVGVSATTDRVLEHQGHLGLDNPLAGVTPKR